MKALIVVLVLFSSSAFAIELPPNTDIQTKIENKQFKGGVDEGDLKVQTNKPAPYRVLLLRKVRQEVYEQVLKEANEATEAEGSEAETPVN